MPPTLQIQRRPVCINELLALIFSYLDDRWLSRAALVSTQWAEIALDKLWHVIKDLRPLLSLLAPLSTERKPAPGGPMTFIVGR